MGSTGGVVKPSGGLPGLVSEKPPFLVLEMTGVPGAELERMRSLSRLLRSIGMCSLGLGLAL